MAEEPAIYCPLCGNKVPPGVTKCLVCATELQKVIPRSTSDMGERRKSLNDYLSKGLPKTELPGAKVTCPQCALELQGGEAKCPRCGIPLKSEQAMLECPECGALTPEDAKVCPNCGVGFEDQGEEVEPPTAPPPVEVKPPELLEPKMLPQAPTEPKPEVVTAAPTGVLAASGQGLVNGRGAVNGTGLIHGSGLVNGTGITNGTKFEGQMTPAMSRRKSFLRSWRFLAVIVAIVVVVPTFVYLSYSAPSEGILIDGNFGDWSRADKLGIYSVAGSAPVDIDEWAIKVKDQQLFLYFRVQGALMGSTNVDSFYLFVDSDNSPGTGYAVSDIGADYLMALSGWDGGIQSTSLDRYQSTTDQYNWTSWEKLSSFSASSGTNQLEAMAAMPISLDGNAKFILMSQDYLSRNSVSYEVPTVGNVLVVEQSTGAGVQTDGMVAQASRVSMLKLVFICQGSGGTVQSIVPSVSGAEFASSFEEFQLGVGQEHVVDLQFDTLESVAGSMVSVSVAPSGITSTFSSIQVIGFPVRAYVTSSPAGIIIDGAFSDWTDKTSPDADAVSVGNADINIDAVGAVNTTSSSSFYVSVVGEMCSGSYVPVIISRPSGPGGGGGGGIVIPQRKTGEDILRVFIDSDMSSATGYPVAISSKTIGADFKIEITGVYGEITSKSLMNYSGDSWDLVSGILVSAANDAQRMELQVSSADISNSESIDYAIEATDWRGRTDLATSVPQGTRAWLVDGATTSRDATALSYQRKLFYDGTNFWSFYWDGTNTVYKYSADGGVTWTAGGSSIFQTGVNEVSIWWDAANSAVYVVGDTTAASLNAYLQKGTVSAATHTITWSGGGGTTVQASTIALGGKNTFVCRDAAGYIWIMSSNLTSTAPSRYDLSTFRSSATDSITSGWLFGGNMLNADTNQPTIKGSVLPAGTGTDVWTAYGYNGIVAARKLTSGVWSAQTTIFTGATAFNTDIAPPCAVVSGNGVIHVIYGNDHEQPVGTSKPYIYYVNNAGSGWSVPHRLESVSNSYGNIYPTISVDSSTGYVYAFWIETDSNGIGATVTGKKNAPPYLDTTWTALTPSGQTAGEKQHLNSIYSGPGETNICWQWTQNVTSPIEVLFDKLPEFKSVILPVLFLTLMIVVGMRRGRDRSRRDQ